MALERYVKIGVEASYGAGATTAAVLVTSARHTTDRGMIFEEDISDFLPTKGYAGALKITGSLEGNVRPDQMNAIWEAVFGIKTPQTVPTRDEYTLGIPKSLEIEIGETTGTLDQHFDIIGVGIKDFTINGEAKEFMKMTCDWFGKDISQGSFGVPTPVAEDPVLFYNTEVSIDGSPIGEAKAFELGINRGLNDDNYVLDSFAIHGLIVNEVAKIKGSLTFTELEYDEIKRATFGSTSASAIPATNDVEEIAIKVVGTDLAGSDKLQIDLPVAIYLDAAKDISGRGEISKKVSYQATSSDVMLTVFN